MNDRIAKEVGALFDQVHYWPKGLYFRSQSHKNFMLDLQNHIGNRGKRCLDLGCGSEMRYKPFIEAHSLEWYGADLVDSNQAEASYVKVTNNHLDFPNHFFDIICAFNVIEHFSHPEPMFAEIQRCLKPGGLFCGACAFWEMEHDSYFHYSYKGLAEILKRHNFQLVSMMPSEYSGLILVGQRFFGGCGRIYGDSLRVRLQSMLLSNLNLVPFFILNILEFVRKRLFLRFNQPLKDCATLYFYARKKDAAIYD